ncbi:MAG: hypothetical protein AAF557_02710 [Pseudomonadota bacterium]
MAERSITADKSHDEIDELIPWFVNGSLSDADAEAIELRCAESPEFMAEIDRQSAIAAGLCMLEPVADENGAKQRSWQKLSAQIESEERARKPLVEKRSWFPSVKGMTALAGTFAAVLLVAVIATSIPDDQEYQTLTSDGQEASLIIKFQAAPGIDEAALKRVLAQHGLTLVGDVSTAGIYQASAPAGEDMEAAANALMAAPEIVFAAPEGQP